MLLSRLHKGVSQTREKKKKKLSQDGWPSMSSPKTHSYVYTKLLMQTSKQPGRNDINRIFKGKWKEVEESYSAPNTAPLVSHCKRDEKKKKKPQGLTPSSLPQLLSVWKYVLLVNLY